MDWKPKSSVEQMQGKRKEKRGQARKMAVERREEAEAEDAEDDD